MGKGNIPNVVGLKVLACVQETKTLGGVQKYRYTYVYSFWLPDGSTPSPGSSGAISYVFQQDAHDTAHYELFVQYAGTIPDNLPTGGNFSSPSYNYFADVHVTNWRTVNLNINGAVTFMGTNIDPATEKTKRAKASTPVAK
jgi:hypothetical protein